ncbi:MAG: GTP cyclohydrolase I type 2 [uncultured Chloroflexi bacterium]|uniref:GTP cyclohydrolase FolE2 n=1 Tax=uncultured Chloroflexota bacterium TaxID=166587 RepID=A0A6J4HZL5_9CHLR|nr:MAG: GTP cyclohydrolase I type 2 [uncultured Chloroflexota bacterium]
MNDTQGSQDVREVDLQRVGVKNVVLPFRIQEQAGGIQTVQTTVQLSVDLPRQYKGTHMSRFIEILEAWKDQPSSSGQLEHILQDTRERLSADRAHIQAAFKYFVEKSAPVSGQRSTMWYDCRFHAMLCKELGYDLVVGVVVPITTVCPCSKEISVAGAHNQRAWLRVNLRTVPGHFLWLEELIAQLESFGSCEIYPLVKRPDEKYVTEKGYFNPKFVEDVLRDVVLWLRAHPLVTWFEVECEADESIHLHNAFAYQLEPVPAAINVFTRDLRHQDVPPPHELLAVVGAGANGKNGLNGSDGNAHGNGKSGHALPDVAARHP